MLAWNVRKLRVAKGVSQEALALEAGVERAYLSKVEKGDENPSLKMVDKLAKALGVQTATLFAVPARLDEQPKNLKGGPKPRSTARAKRSK
ncbi:MAG: helix-turn-helix transcriptional regulator [Nitrospira sp.]|nr:helix-turn-helix transcriptional regulator [Nitrospira sp.]